ncbi:MAG: hypothetical protein Q8P49_02555, partial [Candidatus Liptonbacteria bacterium]|nr:hypothetical protein [Candidatus Liptonbacteria bacterium]
SFISSAVDEPISRICFEPRCEGFSCSARRSEEAVLYALRRRCNAAGHENPRNPDGYGQFLLITASLLLGVLTYTFIRRSLYQPKLARIAAEDILDMGSCHLLGL